MTRKKFDAIEHTFALWKSGELINATATGTDVFERSDAPPALISLDRVFAVDTESTLKEGVLVTDLVPIAWYDETTLIDARDDDKRRVVERFLDEVLTRYGVSSDRPSQTKQRRRRNRGEGDQTKRDGRRSQVPLVVSVWFNLPYDITRLFAETWEVRAIHAGVDAWNMEVRDGLSIEWLLYMDKSAPQFRWMIRDADRKLVCNLAGIDLTGYWKCSLEAASKSLGGEGKTDIEALVPNVHERPFESFTVFEQEARRSYAIKDVAETAFVYRRTVEELCRIDPRVVNQRGMIPPSAPSAAARLMFERAFDAHPSLSTWRKPPAWVDQLGCDGYYGGRAFAARPGIYPKGGFRILDLKSAYPTVMSILPDPVTAKYRRVRASKRFDVDRFAGRFGVLVVSGECLDSRYPAFRAHDEATTRLRYVAGPFYRHRATIPELVIGVLRGALRIDQVHGGVVVEGSPDKSFLRSSILELYALKEREKKSPLGLLAKLLMNSAYGKLIEIVMKELRTRTPTPVPAFTSHIHAIAKSMIRLDIEPEAPAEALFFSTDTDEADTLRRIYAARIDLGVVAYAETMATVHPFEEGGVTLRDFVRGARSYSTGRYFLPIYASQITGLVSAELGTMAACVDAFCGDTDSVHFLCDGDPLAHEGVERYFEIMGKSGYPAPRAGRPETDIAPGCTLGRWESDSTSPSVETVIVRPKVYSHRFEEEGGVVEYKQALHGFSRYTSPEAEAARKNTALSVEDRGKEARDVRRSSLHEDMRRLVLGENVAYVTRPAPRRGRTAAISGEVAGEFVTKRVEVVNPPVFGTEMGEGGYARWLTEAELELYRERR